MQSFYLNVCANEKWGTQNEFAKPFDIQELATTLCSIQLDFQDIGLVDHSVIDLVNTLVNKWNPQVLQLSNKSALLSLNLLYNYNIDVAGVCALQVLINHFAVDVQTTISCTSFTPFVQRRRLGPSSAILCNSKPVPLSSNLFQ